MVKPEHADRVRIEVGSDINNDFGGRRDIDVRTHGAGYGERRADHRGKDVR